MSKVVTIHERVEVYQPKGRNKWIDIIIGYDKWAEKMKAYHTQHGTIQNVQRLPGSTAQEPTPTAQSGNGSAR